MAAKRGIAGQTAYRASKSASKADDRCSAVEPRAKNIRANAVMPPVKVETEMYEKYLNSASRDVVDRECLSKRLSGFAEPTDMENAVIYLLSDASRFVAGISIPVDEKYLV